MSKVCRRRSSTDAMGFARKSSGEQAGSLLSVISFSLAALAKLPNRAATSKARTALSGGSAPDP